MAFIDSQRKPTYFELRHRWLESDVQFVKFIVSNGCPPDHRTMEDVLGVDLYSRKSRIFLKSYTFTKKELAFHEKVKKTLGKMKDGVVKKITINKKMSDRERKRDESSCPSSFLGFFKRLLTCTTKVNVA